MSKTHVVAQGEHLARIARAHGFADWATIWDAPENKELKELRKNPQILHPGDRVFIPDKELREEQKSTEQKHQFVFQGKPLKLRIVLKGLKNQPLQNHECVLTAEGSSETLSTKSDGVLQMDVRPEVATGTLVDRGNSDDAVRTERHIPLRIGELDPVDKVSGQVSRLNNLGYNAGRLPDHPLSGVEEENLRKSVQFRSAVEEFQCDFMGQNNLATIKQVVDGVCGKKTQAKLLEAHGC